MTDPTPATTALPPEIDRCLRELCAALTKSLGERLVSVVLYGGLAEGRYYPASSNVNLLIVARDLEIGTLDTIATAIEPTRREIPLATMLLTPGDLRSSADAFAVKFDDLRHRHRVLFGEDVVAGIEVSRDHLRFRCEQEVKNLLLRLRQRYVASAAFPERIEALLTKSIGTLVTNLSVALRLKTGGAPSEREEIVATAAEAFGFRTEPLRRVLALKSGGFRPDSIELKELFASYVAAVARAADAIDAL